MVSRAINPLLSFHRNMLFTIQHLVKPLPFLEAAATACFHWTRCLVAAVISRRSYGCALTDSMRCTSTASSSISIAGAIAHASFHSLCRDTSFGSSPAHASQHRRTHQYLSKISSVVSPQLHCKLSCIMANKKRTPCPQRKRKMHLQQYLQGPTG